MRDTAIPHSVPCAKIQSQSIYEHEAEVLFSMAAVFRIHAVEKYGSLWVVDLTLIDKEDEEWNTLTAHLNKWSSCLMEFISKMNLSFHPITHKEQKRL